MDYTISTSLDMMLMGVKYIAYTDISKDGTLQGVNMKDKKN